MADFLQAFHTAMSLIVTLDPRLVEIVLLSLKVSLLAVAIASVIGFALGGALAVYRFPGRGAVVGAVERPDGPAAGCGRVYSSICCSRIPVPWACSNCFIRRPR